jgi:hypothetical protein
LSDSQHLKDLPQAVDYVAHHCFLCVCSKPCFCIKNGHDDSQNKGKLSLSLSKHMTACIATAYFGHVPDAGLETG